MTTDPFDIRNHVDFNKYISKDECNALVKKSKPAVSAELVFSKCKEKISQLNEQHQRSSAEGEQKLRDTLLKCQQKIKQLAEKNRELEQTVSTGRDEKLRKIVSKCKSKIQQLAAHNQSLSDQLVELEKKHKDELERSRSEVELSWKKKMYTDIQSHPQYNALVKAHRLDVERERSLRACPDVLKNPEYRKLMSKYVACIDRKRLA